MQYFCYSVINVSDIFFGVLPDLSSACQATVIDSISMNFYIAEPASPGFHYLTF